MKVPPISVIPNNVKTFLMPIEETILDMEGKISLLDNPNFIGLSIVVGTYYVAFLSFLCYLIFHAGGI
jgi:hypothetical protein